MTLSDLTRELFTYLVRFRQLAASPQPPALAQVQRDLEDIFARMEEGTRAHPPLARSYELVRYPLAALADELILDSELKQAAQWQDELLERRLYGTAEAARRVFELAKEAKRWPQDAAGILYLCLGLGFHGQYSPQDAELAALKAELLERLPTRPAPPLPPSPPEPPSLEPLAAIPRPAPPREFSAALAIPRPARRRPGLALGGLAAAAGLALAIWGLWPGAAPRPPETSAPVSPATIIAAPAANAPAPAAQPSAPQPSTQPPPTQQPLETARASIAAVLTPAPRPQPEAKVSTPPAPAPAPAKAPEQAPAPDQPQTYVIQAGLYVGPIQSNRLAESLTAAGFAAWVVERTRADGKLRYLVLVGPFAQKEMAQRAIQAIHEKFGIRPFLTDQEDPGGALR